MLWCFSYWKASRLAEVFTTTIHLLPCEISGKQLSEDLGHLPFRVQQIPICSGIFMKGCMKFCLICVFLKANICIDLVMEVAQLQQTAMVLKAG